MEEEGSPDLLTYINALGQLNGFVVQWTRFVLPCWWATFGTDSTPQKEGIVYNANVPIETARKEQIIFFNATRIL